MSALILA